MKHKNKYINFLINRKWGLGGFVFIIVLGIILWDFTNWRLGDIIATLAVLSSLYVMLYNSHRRDLRFQKLAEQSYVNTLRMIIGPERRKELMIFAEDLEILYYKTQKTKVPIDIIAEELENRENVSDEFLEDFFKFLNYSAKKVTTHNLSAPLKILIFNDFIILSENIEGPISEISKEKKEDLTNLAQEIYSEVVRELNDPKKEFLLKEKKAKND